MGAATLPPWLAPWSSSLLYSGRGYKSAERARDLHRARPRLTIFTYAHANSAPILSSWSEGSGGGSSPGGGAAEPAGLRWERVPLDRPPWHVEVPVPLAPREAAAPYDVTIHTDEHEEMFRSGLAEAEAEAEAEGATRAAALDAYGSIMRGWAIGAVLLALLIVLVRIGERYLDWTILLRRRRLHREWQRANIRTNGVNPSGAGRPPPYSARAPVAAAGAEPKAREEAPPPYALVHGAIKPGVNGVAPPRRVARLFQACGIDMAAEVLPPTGVLDDSFGAITYYASPPVGVAWTHEPLTLPDGDNLEPPPIYSTADPTDHQMDAEPADDDVADNADGNYDEVALNNTDFDPVDTNEAPKDGSVAV